MAATRKQYSSPPREKIEAISPSGSNYGLEPISEIKEKSLLRKLDRKLLPAVTLLYLLSFLDRSNGDLPLPLLLFKTRWLIETLKLAMLVWRGWSKTCI